MLTEKNRLKKKKDFEKVFKKGRSFKEGFLSLRLVKNNSEQIRFGFIISQKVSKKAVVRNKIKRRLRELVKLRLEKMKKGTDITITAAPGIETKGFQELEKTIDKLFKKAGVLNS